MRNNGAAGVIIRAGQNVWPDPKFDTFWAGAKAAGLPRGTYWFYDSRVSPESQADLFYSRFAGDFPEMEKQPDCRVALTGFTIAALVLRVKQTCFIQGLRVTGLKWSSLRITKKATAGSIKAG